MSHTTHHPTTFHSNSKAPSQLTSTLTQENSPELSSAAAKKVSPERRVRESEASSSQPQTTKEHEDFESSSHGDHLKRTSPSITTAATAGQGQGQGEVEYSDYNNKVYTLSPPERRDYSIFPSTPQYDPTLLDISEPLSPFFRSSPRVTPSRYIPSATGPHRSSLPPPKYNMNPTGDIDSIRHVGEDSVRRVGGGGGGGGLDQIIRASESTDFESLPARGRVVVSKNSVEGGGGAEDKDNSSPPRGSALRNGKVTVVSPPEGEVPRKGTTSHRPTSGAGYDLPNVPDSPYGPPGVYPPYQHGAVPYYPPPPPPHGAYPYPPSFPRSANHTADGMEAMDPERYHHSYYYSLPYGYGYDRPHYDAEMFRGASSLGKRKRMQDQLHDDRMHDTEQEISEDYSSGLPPRHYYDRDRPPSYRYYRPPVSESFESSSDGGSKQRRTRTGQTSIAKAPSYPPPPSSNRYGTEGADSSAASYPGARRIGEHGYSGSMIHPSSRLGQGGLPESYGNVVRYPPRYEDSGQGYPPPQDLYSRPSRGYAGPSSGRYVEDTAHYFPPGKTTSPVQKPLRAVHSEDMNVSPLSSAKQNVASNVPPSSLKEGGSPSKAKASTTAQAAIAAGMTEPSSAKEVDFDITAPPSEPITPASAEPICTSSSELNEDDVLCGRGGGTNTQIGNRKFRSLVQEFQPTYLLCRRKEKPQIARTIVLIIRKRGGRFLKKNEDDGTFFEVGDEKAEAKTCQALREGLDVRATKSTIDGRKKSGRARHKNKESLQDGRGSDTVHSETESPRRDGPPGPYYEVFPYAQPPPPQYYYGPYDPYYPPPFDAAGSPHSYSPRKRVARFLTSAGGDTPYAADYHLTSPYKHHGYQYLSEQHSSQRDLSREEANALTWEMEFSPPRSSIVKK